MTAGDFENFFGEIAAAFADYFRRAIFFRFVAQRDDLVGVLWIALHLTPLHRSSESTAARPRPGHLIFAAFHQGWFGYSWLRARLAGSPSRITVLETRGFPH